MKANNATKEALREIKESYKTDKRKIKKTARSRLRLLKHGYCRAVGRLTGVTLSDPPKRSVKEEVLNSVTHGLGALFALIALPFMLIASDNSNELIGSLIYFFGMLASLLSSSLYHAFRHGSAVKRLFRRFDYSSIYLLIGATFILPLLVAIGGTFSKIFIITQWSVIGVGITMIAVFGPSRFRRLHIPLYVILGWSALMLIPGMLTFSPMLALFIFLGGVSYTMGIIPYLMKLSYSHVIWHAFVLLGAILQWYGIYRYLLL